jgi:diacylglycerol kinase (ATP)
MNSSEKPFSLKARLKSFQYAFAGIATLLLREHNAWIHLFAMFVVTGCGLYFGLTATEWCLVILAMTLVLMAEGFNSAIERVCDAVSEEYHPLIKSAKDMAAGAVLISATGALVIGLIVFLPYIMNLG